MATILIVDDLSTNRDVLGAVLERGEHRLLYAADGYQALRVAVAERPDLVITDVLMPAMDGYDLVKQLRARAGTANIPVVFYTAHYGQHEARELAQSMGVAHVITKPFDAADVRRVVAGLLSGTLPTQESGGQITPAQDREHLRLLTDKLSSTTAGFRHANEKLRAIINIGLELASQKDPAQLLQAVCSSARELFGATYATIGIVDLDHGLVRRVVACGTQPDAWLANGDAIPAMFAAVVRERRVLRGREPCRDPECLGLPRGHPPVDAFLAAPIASPSQVYGWLCLVCNEGSGFQQSDEPLALALSAQVGRAFENAHLLAAAQERATALEREVAERKHAIDALAVAEERMRFALDSAAVGIWDMDYVTGKLTWSDQIEAQYGVPTGTFDGTFDAFVERVHPADRDSFLATVGAAKAAGSDFTVENRAIHPDGSIRYLRGAGRVLIDADGTPLRGVGISLDDTAHRRLEGQYLQSQKMEAVGRLAGGVAHDFNNLLTAILGYCELLLADCTPEDPRAENLKEIQAAGRSAAALTRQLLTFSRKQITEPTILDLNEVVSSMRALLVRLIGEDVEVVFVLPTDLGPVRADHGQIEQVVMNLAVNARDAMPSGGKLTIQTTNVFLDEHYERSHIGAKRGHYVALTVTDTGTGMSADVMEHLFEPFFTTKAAGKGTGLGLATVHGIVAGNGGTVEVYSEVGRGTAFTAYLPVVTGGAQIVPVAPPLGPPARTTGETVLLVEDFDALRNLTRLLLERAGYKVLAAANADEAVALFARNDSIDILLTDVVMPGASGPDLTRRLLEKRSTLRVIFMSGYTEEAMIHHGVANSGISFLHEPFSSDALTKKIRDTLGQ